MEARKIIWVFSGLTAVLLFTGFIDLARGGEGVSPKEQTSAIPQNVTLPAVKPSESAKYTVTDVGVQGISDKEGWDPAGERFHLNDKGQVVGLLYHPHCFPRSAVMLEGGKMRLLPNLERIRYLDLRGINNFGQIVGYIGYSVTDTPQMDRALLWENNKTTFLSPFKGFHLASADGINDRGEIVGRAVSGSKPFGVGFLWQRGEPRLILPPEGMEDWAVSPIAINNKGEVTGTLYKDPGFDHIGFLWKKGEKMKLLVPLNERGEVQYRQLPYAINDKGQILGEYSFPGDNSTRPFIWEKGEIKDFLDQEPPKPTKGRPEAWARALNNLGQVAGGDKTGGFLWENGRMTYLQSLVSSNSDWQIGSGYRINDAGQILASGCKNTVKKYDGQHLLLLTPVVASKPQPQETVAKTTEKKNEEKPSLSLKN